MTAFGKHLLLARDGWQDWKHSLLWLTAMAALVGLGVLRVQTGAEYAFASMALFPVAWVTWIGGRTGGYVFAGLAALMWGTADFFSERPFSSPWIPAVNAAVHGLTYLGVAWLVNQVGSHLQREHRAASCDVLTGLSNRRHFLQQGATELARAQRYGHSMAVLFLDLDNFKSLNDTQGHQAGDSALVATAQALRANTRAHDLLCRLGGDEFALVLPHVDFEAAEKAAAKIQTAIEGALQPYPGVSVSIGLAWFSRSDKPFEKMLRLADAQMYAAKARGKGATHARRFT